ncbi:MAG: MFS transporter [Acidobacteria bacterium]|nr:MFS transporter [Acidobacteriota bacterium]
MAEQTQNLGRARAAVYAAFFVAGSGLATWASFIPLVQRRLGLGDAELGQALFSMAAGALCAVVSAGAIIERLGSRRATVISGVLFSLLLPGPVFAASFWTLAGALLVFGFCFGLLDVAMNAQAADVQRLSRKPLMSGFHGLYSFGGLAGSALAGLLFRLAVPGSAHVGAMVVALLALTLLAGPALLPTAPRAGRGPALSLPARRLAGLALLGFLMFVGEGAIMDWANVYLANVLQAPADLAVAGFAAFSFAMAAGRFGGDWATARLGSSRFAVLSALLGAAGLGLAISSSSVAVSVAGFAATGLGFANLVPILFSHAAESTPDAPQQGISGVAGVGYFGLVAGPPTIGFMAEELGLRGALGIVALAMAVAAVSLPAAFRRALRDS